MQHLHTVPIVSSNLTTSTNRVFWGDISVVVCTLVCETGSMGSFPIYHPNQYASVAPMVEQRTENSCVAGSSPACGTKYSSLVQWLEPCRDMAKT